MINNICYECSFACHRAGKMLTNTTRLCNGSKDPKFLGCAGLENPNKRKNFQNRKHHIAEKTAMEIALKKAGIL